MVSPCKKEDPQKHHVKYTSTGKKTSKSTFVKGSKTQENKYKANPFVNKVVYLDLKSRKESSNLEASLKSLGAEVAVFLDRRVTHLVSDRYLVGPGGSSTVVSPAASVSPVFSHSPCTSENSPLPRSRGAAMLERVSSLSHTGYLDPVTLALQWRIPVLSAAKLWSEISRLPRSTSHAHKKTTATVTPSRDFVKVESLVGSWKPDLLKLERWPVLDLDNPTGLSPFQWDAGHGVTPRERKGMYNTMTRRPFKNSVNSEEDTAGGAIGAKSSSLCNGHVPPRHSPNDDLKVQCNGLSSGLRSSKLLSPSGSDVLPLPTQRRSTRRTSASWCGSTRELSQLSPALSPPPASPISPSDSELGVTLRPKGTLWLPVALIGTTAEEHGNSIRRRGGSDASLSSLDPSKPRKKKLSPEEKLLQDNKEYFKMEVLHTKLRSSGPRTSHHLSNGSIVKLPAKARRGRWTKGKNSVVDSVDYEALIVENKIMKLNGVKKPKRTRRSELMKLCDEAESFMFGESSRQSAPSAASCGDSEEEAPREDDPTEETEGVSCDEAARPPRPRKRRSHAEAFIHDNLDYYKFETPGSRLRSQGSTGEPDGSASTTSDDGRDLTFSFQAVPCTEPWYDVFRRQDEGREVHFPVISDPANQPFLLPYEMPRLSLPRPEPADYYVKRRLRLAQIVAQNHPRKSPRCHASTLAILSSLKRRKRRSSTSVGAGDVDASPGKDDLLGLTDELVEELPLLDPVDAELPATAATPTRRKKTEERLALCAAETVPIQAQPADVVALVANFCAGATLPATSTPTSRGPRRRRKARFNKTGWDKVKTRGRKALKGRSAPANTGITTDNIVTSPRRSPPAVSPCVVRVRKLSHSYCRKLVLTRRRRPTADYSWTTRKR